MRKYWNYLFHANPSLGIKSIDIFNLGVLGVFLIFMMWVYYPGILDADSLTMIEEGRELYITIILSYLYPLALCLSTLVGCGVFGAVFVQNIIIFLALGWVLICLRRLGASRLALWLLLALIVSSPVVANFANLIRRDALSGFLNFYTLTLLFYLLINKRYFDQDPTRGQFLSLALLLTLIFLIRLDNAMIVLGVGLACMGFRMSFLKFFACLATVALPIFAMHYLLLRPMVQNPSKDKSFPVASIINPVGILVEDGLVKTDPAFSGPINRVVPVDLVQENWTPYSVDYFFNEYIDRHPLTLNYDWSDIGELYLLTLKGLSRRPDAVLGERMRTSMAMVGLTNAPCRTVYPSDLVTTPLNLVPKNFKNEIAFYQREDGHAIQSKYPWLRYLQTRYAWDKIGGSQWTAIVQLLFVALGLSMFSYPVTATVCAILSLRLGVVFLIAPCSHFCYIADLYLFGALVPWLYFRERYCMRQQLRESGRLSV